MDAFTRRTFVGCGILAVVGALLALVVLIPPRYSEDIVSMAIFVLAASIGEGSWIFAVYGRHLIERANARTKFHAMIDPKNPNNYNFEKGRYEFSILEE